MAGESCAAFPSPIIPLILGDEAAAVAHSVALREQGLFVPAIRYPAVARGKARLRVTLTAAHTPDDVAVLTDALRCTAPAPSSRVS